METYVGFVRAVMLGRDGLHRSVLLNLFRDAGAANVVSYITTGNVSFDADLDGLDGLVSHAERGIERVVGRRTEVFVRAADALAAMQDDDPFQHQPLELPHEQAVAFFYDTVPDGLELPIRSPAGDVVVFAARRRELLSVSVRENGLSRGAGGLIEKATGERVTSRAWSTVERILDKLA